MEKGNQSVWFLIGVSVWSGLLAWLIARAVAKYYGAQLLKDAEDMRKALEIYDQAIDRR